MSAAKHLAYLLYIVACTSLWWSVFAFHDYIFLCFSVFSSLPIVVAVVGYLVNHWDDTNVTSNIKEIKFILYTLCIVAYTSLWWFVFIFHNAISLEIRLTITILLAFFTLKILSFCLSYIITHWSDNKQIK